MQVMFLLMHLENIQCFLGKIRLQGSPPLFKTDLPITSAPLTPGASGSPIHVSIKTKFNQDSTAAIIMAMISFNLIPPFEV